MVSVWSQLRLDLRVLTTHRVGGPSRCPERAAKADAIFRRLRDVDDDWLTDDDKVTSPACFEASYTCQSALDRHVEIQTEAARHSGASVSSVYFTEAEVLELLQRYVSSPREGR